MKRIETVVMFIFCALTISMHLDSNPSFGHSNRMISPIISDLQTAKKVSWCRMTLVPALIAFVAYTHKDSITHTISHNPGYFLAASYLVGNYIIDTCAQYHKINKSLDMLMTSQIMHHYVLCLHAIKQSLDQNSLLSKRTESFFETIKNATGYTIEELEFFSTKLVQQCRCTINELGIDEDHSNQQDQIYYLLKDKITIQQILAASEYDKILHAALVTYEKNPEEAYNATIQLICKLIKTEINSFIKKNLHIFSEIR